MTHNNKKCIVIIQARSDSQRLPRKVLAKIVGKPMLWHVINRAKKMGVEVIVATTDRKIDDKIARIAQKSHVKCFRGKTRNVLDRFYKASLKFKGEIIVRITSDCPLIDPKASAKALRKFLEGKYDYITNDEGTDPKGLDTEVFSFSALEKSWLEAKTEQEREHVTHYIRSNPAKFRIGTVKITRILRPQRWVVDYPEDLEFVRAVYSRLYKKKNIFLTKDIIELLKKEPELAMMNSKYDT